MRGLTRSNQIGCLAGCLSVLAGCSQGVPEDGCYHVMEGASIQDAMDLAAADPQRKCVKVHAGTYQPQAVGQALIWFNQRHDGITVEAVGTVTLTAANPDLGRSNRPGYPAMVNHVVYFGDGIGRGTTLRGFRITGANNFVTRAAGSDPIEPSTQYKKNMFFYADGGGVKIFGRSYPTLEGLEIFDNYASPCAGGVSVQHPLPGRGAATKAFDETVSVLIKDCIFRNNRARVTGSALDLLWGSSVILENCLFVANISNTDTDFTIPAGKQPVYDQTHGCGALTVFRGARIRARRCTFTGNYNGVDDMSAGSSYTASIFWRNNATGGIAPGERFEVAMADGRAVRDCFLNGDITDLRGNVSRRGNTFDAADPDFDDDFRPQASGYEVVGYRPPVSGATP
jgi:hypothetical protein